MDIQRLVTLTFDKNVGTMDRIFRLVSGAGVAGAAWLLPLSQWAAVLMTVFGVMWFATGVLSKCSIYYMLGYSTCPSSGRMRNG